MVVLRGCATGCMCLPSLSKNMGSEAPGEETGLAVEAIGQATLFNSIVTHSLLVICNPSTRSPAHRLIVCSSSPPSCALPALSRYSTAATATTAARHHTRLGIFPTRGLHALCTPTQHPPLRLILIPSSGYFPPPSVAASLRSFTVPSCPPSRR